MADVAVHKSQGLTLDAVQVSLVGLTAPGKACVALSRARTKEGLQIVEWDGNEGPCWCGSGCAAALAAKRPPLRNPRLATPGHADVATPLPSQDETHGQSGARIHYYSVD